MDNKKQERLPLHLVSAPWASMTQPSLQLGALKAYVDKTLADLVDCRVYSAFLYLHLQTFSLFGKSIVSDKTMGRELLYLYHYYKDFKPKDEFESLKKTITDYYVKTNAIGEGEIDLIGGITRTYIKKEIIPNIICGKLNVLGFSLVYDQFYASVYFIKTIERLLPDEKFLYIFGGDSVTDVHVVQTLNKLGIDGWCVVGQGEKKLEYLLKQLLDEESSFGSNLAAISSKKEAGLFRVSNPPSDLDELSPTYFSNEIVNRDEISVPDYGEYFYLLNKYSDSEFALKYKNTNVELPIEISRGCYGNCDFCNKNRQSPKFIERSKQTILEYCLAIVSQYRMNKIFFVDNVCDWAIGFAQAVLKNSLDLEFYMALRVGYSEEEYTLLALAGLRYATFGIEAFSQRLLNAMNKQTTVIDNIKALKYAQELNIQSLSNLILAHPKSTIEDVRETRAVLEKLQHVKKPLRDAFFFTPNSPIYKTLEEKQKKWIHPLCLDEKIYSPIISSSSYFYTENHLPEGWTELSLAWDELEKWYQSVDSERNFINCYTMSENHVLVEYGVNDVFKRIVLDGNNARVFNAAHKGLTAQEIAQNRCMNIDDVISSLNYLVSESIVLAVENYYLTIALRKRDVLITNFYNKYYPQQIKG